MRPVRIGERNCLLSVPPTPTLPLRGEGARRSVRLGRMTRPNLRVTSVTIGTSQPRELARFYADLLGWPVTASYGPRPGMPEQEGWAQIKPPPDGTGPTINFEYERCFQRPVRLAPQSRAAGRGRGARAASRPGRGLGRPRAGRARMGPGAPPTPPRPCR